MRNDPSGALISLTKGNLGFFNRLSLVVASSLERR